MCGWLWRFRSRIGFCRFARRTAWRRQRGSLRRLRRLSGLLLAAATPSAPTTAVAIAAKSLRRLFAAAGHGCWLGVLRLGVRLFGRRRGRVVVNFLAIADIVRNWFRKSRLKRRRLVLPLSLRLLFAPLSTVAHPSAHVALVTRPWCRRQRQASSGERELTTQL